MTVTRVRTSTGWEDLQKVGPPGTPGAPGDTWYVQGVDGWDYPGEIPTAMLHEGDLFLYTAGPIFRYSGGGWSSVGNIMGPTGPAGPTGPGGPATLQSAHFDVPAGVAHDLC